MSAPSLFGLVALLVAGLLQGPARAADDLFGPIYQVMQSPRCTNCHTDTEAPLQRENRPHIPAVKRGPEGKGVAPSLCSNCHKAKNTAMAPGAPNWRMPPPRQAVFRERTEAALCRQITDPKQNGNRDTEALGKHFRDDPLTGWAWNAGVGRKPPALPHDQLVAAVAAWLRAGAPCPAQ